MADFQLIQWKNQPKMSSNRHENRSIQSLKVSEMVESNGIVRILQIKIPNLWDMLRLSA